MRRAKLRDRWRGMPGVAHKAVGTTVPLADPYGALPATLELRSLVTVISGLNGVGKTRLLRLAADAIGEDARLISVHNLCIWLQTELATRADLKDLVDEAGALPIDKEAIAAVKAIVGRDYDDISWYALDIADSPFADIVGDDVVPFFEVTDGPVHYQSSQMGLGELAAHVLLWINWYLRETDGLVLLLDEPDAYLPPSSRELLLDHLASHAVVRKHAVVVTSHNRELIEPALNQDGVLAYLGVQDGAATLTTEPDDLREIVGTVLFDVGPAPEEPPAPVELRLLAWVEDDAAAALTTALFAAIAPELIESIAIYWGSGNGGLVQLESHLPRPEVAPHPLEFALIFDGDQDKVPKHRVDRWPAVRLPGERSPDELFVEHLSGSLDQLTSALDGRKPVVAALLERLRGLDPHDWTDGFIEGTGLTRADGLALLSRALLMTAAGEDLVNEFRETLLGTGLNVFTAIAVSQDAAEPT
jgi:hypothetical protein